MPFDPLPAHCPLCKGISTHDPNCPERQDSKQQFAVDLPNLTKDFEWTNLAVFDTREEALDYILDTFGECDEDGKISLLSILDS